MYNYLGFGTNKYPKLSESSNLAQCEADIKRLSSVLGSKLNFNVEIYLAAETTKKNVLNKIKSKISELENKGKNENKTQFLLIHRSSHGTQQPDLNGDESDMADEAWVMYDTSWDYMKNRWENVILDDDIYNCLIDVNPKHLIVEIISDTCNSGTFSKNLIPYFDFTRKFIFPRNFKLYKLKIKKKEIINKYYWTEIPDIHWSVIAGSLSNTFSYENSSGGILTTNIARYVTRNYNSLPSRKIAMKEIADSILKENSKQHSHLEAPLFIANKTFFGVNDAQEETTQKKTLWQKLISFLLNILKINKGE
jgi:hypothetical protein